MSVDDAITEVVEEAIDADESATTVVVVGADGDGDTGDSVSAEALSVAETVHIIAVEEAEEAAEKAVIVSAALAAEQYVSKDEMLSIVEQSVATAIAATIAANAVVDAVEPIEEDEVPEPGSNHWFYRKFGR